MNCYHFLSWVSVVVLLNQSINISEWGMRAYKEENASFWHSKKDSIEIIICLKFLKNLRILIEIWKSYKIEQSRHPLLLFLRVILEAKWKINLEKHFLLFPVINYNKVFTYFCVFLFAVRSLYYIPFNTWYWRKQFMWISFIVLILWITLKS